MRHTILVTFSSAFFVSFLTRTRYALILFIGLGLLCQSLQASETRSNDARGAELALHLRSQRPSEPFLTTGVLRQRGPDGKWRSPIPVQFEIRTNDDSWQSIYRAYRTGGDVFQTLVVTHHASRPNTYELWSYSNSPNGAPTKLLLDGDTASVPFANSEFWLCDLGLEFLYWPTQRTVGNQMRKGRACHVLESIHPNPPPDAYARVLSWIDVEHRGILRAEAYDRNKKLMKEFNIGSFQKVNGRWQLKSMEIRNERTDARTRIEFDLEIAE